MVRHSLITLKVLFIIFSIQDMILHLAVCPLSGSSRKTLHLKVTKALLPIMLYFFILILFKGGVHAYDAVASIINPLQYCPNTIQIKSLFDWKYV
jgi:hypothetical protein